MKIIKKSSFTHKIHKIDKLSECFIPLVDYKFKILLNDGNCIEAGIFKFLINEKEEMHACISTQAGCKFGCIMCKSGKSGFVRNLSQEEILEQVSLLSTLVGVIVFDHIVFMGIGEPLDNYDNFVGSVIDIVHDNNFYVGRLSFATVGLPKKLIRLTREPIPDFGMLWISLHAASDEKRKEIMPISKTYSLKEIVKAAEYFAKCKKTKVWINYMIFLGFNDSKQDASLLAKILMNTENIFSVMLTEPNNDLPLYLGGDYHDLTRFENYLLDCNVKNDIAKFIAAGKNVNAGCGEFVFTSIY